MEYYNDQETVISSDEYSSEEDDALIATTIISRKNSVPKRTQLARRVISKMKLSGKDFKIIKKRVRWYKKWISNKTNRQMYRNLMKTSSKNFRGKDETSFGSKNMYEHVSLPSKIRNNVASTDVIEVIDDENESNDIQIDNVTMNIKNQTVEKNVNQVESDVKITNDLLEGNEKEKFTSIVETHFSEIEQNTWDIKNKQPKDTSLKENKEDNIQKNYNNLSSNIQPSSSKKRLRSPSPKLESFDEYTKLNLKTKFYNEINEIFPKMDSALENHVKPISSTEETIDENLTCLAQEIETLTELIQTKENEINRLFYLKKIKEEIANRLERSKRLLKVKNRSFHKNEYTLLELKEIDMFLSNSKSFLSHQMPKTTTTKELVENIANMGSSDLEKERHNTSRLHSILLSKNILPRSQNVNQHNLHAKEHRLQEENGPTLLRNSKVIGNEQYLETRVKSSVGRQGPFRDVKSLIADFRQNNPELYPRVGKRIKLNESAENMRHLYESNEHLNESYNANHLSTLEKLLSNTSSNNNNYNLKRPVPDSQGFRYKDDYQCNNYRSKNPRYEQEQVSISSIGNENYSQRSIDHQTELLRKALHTNIPQMRMDYIENGNDYKNDLKSKNLNDEENNICQECMANEAMFVCAGCQNQWYCSRDCQISAWERHSELCDV